MGVGNADGNKNYSSTFSRVSLWPLFFAMLTAGVLYGPVLLAFGTAPSPWADLSTPAGWWEYVSGRLYHGYLFALPAAFWPQRLLAWAGLLARQFTPAGALLALWGWLRLLRERPALAIVTALVSGGFSLYALGYNTADSLIYLVPALPVMALWLGIGLQAILSVSSFQRPAFRYLPFLIPLVQIAWGWQTLAVSRDDIAITWALETLHAAPSGAVLVTSQDAATFTLWYAQDVLRERSDVLIMDRDLWGQEPYRKFLAGGWGIFLPYGPLEEALGCLNRPVVTVHAPLEVSP